MSEPTLVKRGLSRDQLTSVITERTYEYVDIPEWNGSVKLRVMNGLEAETFMEQTQERKKRGESSMYALISACAVDEDNNRLFPDPDALRSVSMKVLARLQKAALKLQGFREEDADDAKNA